MIDLLGISYVNGDRSSIDYAHRKSSFKSMEELEQYRGYLEKKLKKQLFFDYRKMEQTV